MTFNRFMKLVISGAIILLTMFVNWMESGLTTPTYVEADENIYIHYLNLPNEYIGYTTSLVFDNVQIKEYSIEQADATISIHSEPFYELDTVDDNYVSKDVKGEVAETNESETENETAVETEVENEAGTDITESTKTKKSIAIGYSPMVAIFPDTIHNNASVNFTEYKNDNYTSYIVDMYSVVNKILQTDSCEATPKELGFSGKDIAVKIGIPDTGATFRKDAIDALIYCITHGEEVNEENAEYVKESIKKIIDNAVVVNNPRNQAADNRDLILIMPEHSAGNHSYIRPVYWNKCLASRVYINSNGSVDDAIIDNIASELKSDSRLFNKTGIRNDVDGTKSPPNSEFISRINILYSQDNLEDYLGKGYWK